MIALKMGIIGKILQLTPCGLDETPRGNGCHVSGYIIRFSVVTCNYLLVIV